jgi:hypothetical protein
MEQMIKSTARLIVTLLGISADQPTPCTAYRTVPIENGNRVWQNFAGTCHRWSHTYRRQGDSASMALGIAVPPVRSKTS